MYSVCVLSSCVFSMCTELLCFQLGVRELLCCDCDWIQIVHYSWMTYKMQTHINRVCILSHMYKCSLHFPAGWQLLAASDDVVRT